MVAAADSLVELDLEDIGEPVDATPVDEISVVVTSGLMFRSHPRALEVRRETGSVNGYRRVPCEGKGRGRTGDGRCGIRFGAGELIDVGRRCSCRLPIVDLEQMRSPALD